jgi:acetylornithine deacetylase/succinyl-diaminopimelate desuccinylase-like protein
MRDVEDYLLASEAESIEELKEFCRIPSVSTDPAFRNDISTAVDFLVERLKRAGFPVVDVAGTEGHPAVIAERCETPAAPTILVYGHYDVQPPDPLDRWETPPFEPTIRNDRLYARGVSDDKGPLMIPILVAGDSTSRTKLSEIPMPAMVPTLCRTVVPMLIGNAVALRSAGDFSAVHRAAAVRHRT